MVLDISVKEATALIEAIETAHLPVKTLLWSLHNKLKEKSVE
jgi:hypothetical protein